MSWHSDNAFAVTVAGGSIGGLCAAIALRSIGCDVNVYERIGGPMKTQGAGIVVQGELLRILAESRGPALAVTSCKGRRFLNADGGKGIFHAMPQEFTSWEAIYTALRARFPGSRYHAGSELSLPVQDGDKVLTSLASGAQVESDLFVSADGSNSAARRHLLPDVHPSYAGYVAWRGTVAEGELPSDLRSFFEDAFTFSEARSGGHILVYFIPGENADVRPGHRRLNWVWYVRAEGAQLFRMLTDRNGRTHRSSLAPGFAQETILAELVAAAEREVHPMLAKLVEATPEPFLQTIVDVVVPRTRFGRTYLAGDAAFVVRPHTAGATAKAAYDALVLGKAVGQARSNVEIGLQEAERLQLEYGRSLVHYGIDLGGRWASAR